jgi:hypothetical protein
MLVRATHQGLQLAAFAASVLALSGMRRLVDLCHQMNQVLQGP